MKTFIQFIAEAYKPKAPKATLVVEPTEKGTNMARHPVLASLPTNHNEDEVLKSHFTADTFPDAKQRKLAHEVVMRYAQFPGSVSGPQKPGLVAQHPRGKAAQADIKALLANPDLRVKKDLGPVHLYHGMRKEPHFDENGHILLGNSVVVSTSTRPHKALGAARPEKHVGSETKDAHHILHITHPNNDDHHLVAIHNVERDNGTRMARKEQEVWMPPTIFHRAAGGDEYIGDHPDDNLPIIVHHVTPVVAHPQFMTGDQHKRMIAQHGHLFGQDYDTHPILATQVRPVEKKKKK